MEENLFKKISYITAVLMLGLVSYLAFVRKPAGEVSATSKLATFLGLKTTPEIKVEVGNQKDLSIDSSAPTATGNSTNGSQPAAQTRTDKPKSLYTVKEGDTYGCISEAYYGSYEHWPDILNVNAKYGRGFSVYTLYVDAVLELPAISATNLKPVSHLCS